MVSPLITFGDNYESKGIKMKVNLQDEKAKIATPEFKLILAWTESSLRRQKMPDKNTKKREIDITKRE